MILPISGINNNNYYRGQSFKGSALLSNNTASAYKKLDVNSADYIKYIYNRVKNWCKEVVEINVETGRLQKIVQSDEPYIFIMNHTTTQGRDINAAKFFNTLLYREYIYHSKAETCPRSKILANTGVLKTAKDGGKELEWMGVVPVYAGLADKDKQFKNASVIKNLAKQIIDGKTNLFIFPEGALAALTFLPMKYKFQPGVSAIIKKVLEVRDKIKVIPLGFAHNKKESAIHIGDEVIFSKKDGNYFAGKGNADSPFFDADLKTLWEDNDSIMLTESGKPVQISNVVPFISGILMKNLECCSKEAKQDLNKDDKKIYKI